VVLSMAMRQGLTFSGQISCLMYTMDCVWKFCGLRKAVKPPPGRAFNCRTRYINQYMHLPENSLSALAPSRNNRIQHSGVFLDDVFLLVLTFPWATIHPSSLSSHTMVSYQFS
jgi:hypothetical protein